MPKPSIKMINKIKEGFPELEVDRIVSLFDASYSFNQAKVNQALLDAMFDCYICGILVQKEVLAKSCETAKCTKRAKCTNCTGKCGK